MISLDVATDRLLHRPSYLKAFLEGRSEELELSTRDLAALDSIDKTQLVETAVAVRSSLLQRKHRGSGGIEQCWPQTLAAWRTEHNDDKLHVFTDRFMESEIFERYREVHHMGPGLCLEEAVFRFFEVCDTGDARVREHEFLAGLCKALAMNSAPSFLVGDPLRRAPAGWFAVSMRGEPQLFAALSGRYVSGALTPFLAELLLSEKTPDQLTADFDVDEDVVAAALGRFESLGILPPRP